MAPILAYVTGVYGTIHSKAGDFDTRAPERIDVDCELTTYWLPVENVPFDATMESLTLHLGIHAVVVAIPSQRVRKGDRLTVLAPVSMSGLKAVHTDLPTWSKRSP